MLVHSFESMGARDGEGLRYIVFLAGCPLRCVYCHNPDLWQGKGKEYTPQQVVENAIKYKDYFGEKGGITISGGEPLMQAEFCKEVFLLAKMQALFQFHLEQFSLLVEVANHKNLFHHIAQQV